MEIRTKRSAQSNYTPSSRTKVDYLVIHYTGNRGDMASANAAYFASGSRGASAHYFVDENEVWQSVAEQDIAWHCGTSGSYRHPLCRNKNSIGIEICMLDKHGEVRQGSVKRAVELTRSLMEKYRIAPEHVVRHYDVTGKLCPAPFVREERLWADFRNALTKEEESMTGKEIYEALQGYLAEQSAPAWAEAELREAVALGITDGKRPMELVPRYQAAIMAKRALGC